MKNKGLVYRCLEHNIYHKMIVDTLLYSGVFLLEVENPRDSFIFDRTKNFTSKMKVQT